MAENYIELIVKAVDKATATLKNVGSSTSKLSKDTDNLTSSNEKVAQSFSVAKTAAIAFATYGLVVVSKSLVTVASDIETLSLRLGILFKSTSEGSKAFEVMANYASQVPFSLEEIQQGAGALAVVSKNADDLGKKLVIAGNIAASSGLDFRTTAEQLLRAYSGGLAAAEQFNEKGVREMLGFEKGVSLSISRTEKVLEDAYGEGGTFGDSSAKLATTYKGTLSMIGDITFTLQRIISGQFFPALKQHLNNLLTFLRANMDELRVFAILVGRTIVDAMNAFVTVVGFLRDNWDKVVIVLKVFTTLGLLKAITGIIGVIKLLNKALAGTAIISMIVSGQWLKLGKNIVIAGAAYLAFNKILEEYEERLLQMVGLAPPTPVNDEDVEKLTLFMAMVTEAFEGLKSGASEAYEAWTQTTTEIFETTSKAVVGAITSGVDAIGTAFGEMIAEGKSFKDSMSAIWKDLKKQVIVAIAQMMVKMLAMIALGLILNTLLPGIGLAGGTSFDSDHLSQISKLGGGGLKLFAKGGVTNALSVPSFAQGGVTRAPQLALIGDNSNNREAVVPLPDGRSIPVDMKGGVQSIGQLNILPNASIDEALMNQPMSYWEDLVQERILPAINTLGSQGESITTEFRSKR